MYVKKEYSIEDLQVRTSLTCRLDSLDYFNSVGYARVDIMTVNFSLFSGAHGGCNVFIDPTLEMNIQPYENTEFSQEEIGYIKLTCKSIINKHMWHVEEQQEYFRNLPEVTAHNVNMVVAVLTN